MVAGLAMAACGGGDDSSPPGDEADAASDVGGDGDNGTGEDGPATGGGGAASVQVGGSSYEFSGATDCFPDPNAPGGLAIRFDDGADFVSLNQVGDTILVRARLDGSEYADNGSPDPPVVSGNSVTWSGEMGADGEPQNVQISFNC
jgi:hypothetical protein